MIKRLDEDDDISLHDIVKKVNELVSGWNGEHSRAGDSHDPHQCAGLAKQRMRMIHSRGGWTGVEYIGKVDTESYMGWFKMRAGWCPAYGWEAPE